MPKNNIFDTKNYTHHCGGIQTYIYVHTNLTMHIQ